MPTVENFFNDELKPFLIDQKKSREVFEYAKQQYTEARALKRLRIESVKRNVYALEEIERFVSQYSEFFSGKLGRRRKNREYISPILSTVVDKKCSSGWTPTIKFEPEERFGPGADIFIARNANNAHDFLVDKGNFFGEARKGCLDLFVKGRVVLQKAWRVKETADGFPRPTIIEWKHRRWENVYWTIDEHNFYFVDEMTFEEAVHQFGDEILSHKITGNADDPFGTDGEILDYRRSDHRRKKIKVVQYYNDVRKYFAVWVGGGPDPFRFAIEGNYMHITPDGDGFYPFDIFDAYAVTSQGHPISDVDKIVSIWESHSEQFSMMLRRAVKSSRAREIMGSEESPRDARKLWLQSEADWAADLDIPHFVKTTGGVGGTFFKSTLDAGVNINDPMAVRNAFFEEVMIATGVDLRAQDAKTLGQDQLRLLRELDSTDNNIKINEPRWKNFAMTNMYMLADEDVNAEFLDEYIAIEDEVSEELGERADGTVRDIIQNLAGFPFNVKVSVNHANSKAKQVEIFQKTDAIATLAPIFGGSPAVREMVVDLALTKFPNLKLTADQFKADVAIPAAQPGAGAAALPTPEETPVELTA